MERRTFIRTAGLGAMALNAGRATSTAAAAPERQPILMKLGT